MVTAALDRTTRAAVILATVVATVMIAQQIASKSLRDTFFLLHYPVSALPVLTISAAVVSLGMVGVMSWALRRFGPGTVVPAIFALSAGLYVAEWAAMAAAPRIIAVVVYLHTVTFGASATSGFWGVVNERFDPNVAKRVMGRIGAGATLGGLLGGLAVWGGVRLVALETLLLFLAALNAGCAVGLYRVPGTAAERGPASASKNAQSEAGRSASSTYVFAIGQFVMLTGFATALFDYVFKARAAETVGAGAALASFFALYHTATGALTFVVQNGLVSRTLVRFGVAPTLGVMPTVGLVFGGLAALIPGLAPVAVLRGLGAVTENSFFRSSYELLYTPLPPAHKRAAKLLIDVGADRLGTTLGGGLVLIVLAWLGPSEGLLLLIGAGLAGLLLGSLAVLHRGYVAALAESLRRGTVGLDAPSGEPVLNESLLRDVVDRTIASARLGDLIRTEAPGTAPTQGDTTGVFTAEARGRLETAMKAYTERLGTPRGWTRPESEKAAEPVSGGPDDVLETIGALRSGDVSKMQSALRSTANEHPIMVGHLLAVLDHPELASGAERALVRHAARAAGQLDDTLRSPRGSVRQRSRVAHVLASAPEPRTADALEHGLDDPLLEIRHACAIALDRVCDRHPRLAPDGRRIFELVERELERRGTGAHVRIPDAGGRRSPFFDPDRPDVPGPVVHVFTLLGLTLDRQALLLALRALGRQGDASRGTALEYLDSVLPASTRQKLDQWMEGGQTLQPVVALDPHRARALGKALASGEIELGELRSAYRGSPNRPDPVT